jgi:hypothetical protein
MQVNFVDNNYSDYKAILKNELRINSVVPGEFYDTFILRLVPHLQKLKTKDEVFGIIRIELLNEFKPDELPALEEIKSLSDKLFEFHKEVNRDHRSEKLNRIHGIIGLILIALNVMSFLAMSLYDRGGYSMGRLSLVIGLIICVLPSLSGLLSFKKKRESYFGIGHFIWGIVNLGLIYFFSDVLIGLIASR